jgi:hypothetical protein
MDEASGNGNLVFICGLDKSGKCVEFVKTLGDRDSAIDKVCNIENEHLKCGDIAHKILASAPFDVVFEREKRTIKINTLYIVDSRT